MHSCYNYLIRYYLQNDAMLHVGHGTKPDRMYLRQLWQTGVGTISSLSIQPLKPPCIVETIGSSLNITSPTSMVLFATTWRPKRGSYC